MCVCVLMSKCVGGDWQFNRCVVCTDSMTSILHAQYDTFECSHAYCPDVKQQRGTLCLTGATPRYLSRISIKTSSLLTQKKRNYLLGIAFQFSHLASVLEMCILDFCQNRNLSL